MQGARYYSSVAKWQAKIQNGPGKYYDMVNKCFKSENGYLNFNFSSLSFSFDNSDYQRNGDYFPTRLNVQKDGINLVCLTKLRSNPENNVGLMTLSKYAGSRYFYCYWTILRVYLQHRWSAGHTDQRCGSHILKNAFDSAKGGNKSSNWNSNCSFGVEASPRQKS